MEIVADGYVCVDCAYVMANGDLPDETENYPERLKEVAEATAGWSYAADEEHEDLEFSWSECECCGSTLGGSRYWAVKLG